MILALLAVVASVPAAAAPQRGSVRATFTTSIVDNQPTDSIDVADEGTPALFFTAIRNLAGARVTHVWTCGSRIRRRVTFTVKGARTGVSSTLPASPCERWTVQAIVNGVVRARKGLGIRHVIDVFRDLAYVPEGWPLQMAPSHTAAGGLADTPFETLKAEPHYESSHVLYGYLPLGSGADRRVTFVVDGLDEPTWTVWIDRNNNQDLTDDGPPVRNEGTGRFGAQIEVTMHIATTTSDRPFPYKVWLWLAPPAGVSSPAPSQHQPLFYARSHYAGTIRLGGATYRVVAFERLHHDGLFEEGDVCVDLNRNDTCDEPREIVRANRPLTIHGRQYLARVRGGGP